MKRIFLFFFVFIAPLHATSQWKYTGFGDLSGDEVGTDLAFGIHDTILFASYSGHGIWRYTFATGWAQTSDNGIDFTQGSIRSFTSQGPYVFGALTNTKGGNGAVYRSTDNGSNWSEVIGGPICSNGSYLLAQYGTTVARSLDGGKSWQHLDTPLSASTYATNGLYFFAYTASGILCSKDSGMSWSKTNAPSSLSISAFAVMDTQIFAGGTGVFRSTDSGLNWTQIGLATRKVNALAVYGAYMFAAIDTGVLVSSDSGKNWHDVSTGMGTRPGFPRDVTLLAILDTQLFAEVYTGTDASNNEYGYVAARPISEMTNPDSTESVVQTIPASDTIEVYPNPATGIVTILSGGTSILGVSVMDVLGEEVLTVSNARESEINLDISKLASGTYFLRIETANGNVLRKIVKEE